MRWRIDEAFAERSVVTTGKWGRFFFSSSTILGTLKFARSDFGDMCRIVDLRREGGYKDVMGIGMEPSHPYITTSKNSRMNS